MEHFDDLVQMVFTIVLISSIVILPFKYSSLQEIYWVHQFAASSSTWFVTVRLLQLNSIQRWLVRTVRRREAPDEEDNGLSHIDNR